MPNPPSYFAGILLAFLFLAARLLLAICLYRLACLLFVRFMPVFLPAKCLLFVGLSPQLSAFCLLFIGFCNCKIRILSYKMHLVRDDSLRPS